MKRTLLASLALAAAAMIPLTFATASTGDAASALPVDCGETSFVTYFMNQSIMGEGGSSTEAAFDAHKKLSDLMIASSGVKCAQCEIPGACYAKPSFDDAYVEDHGPVMVGQYTWSHKLTFNGKFNISCTTCSN